MPRLLLLLSVAFLIFSCQSEETFAPVEEVSFPGVDERLWPYFESFEQEAQARNLNIDLTREGITGDIVNINQGTVAGQCNFNSHRAEHLTVDLEFWNRAPVVLREFIVFHELGHCSLFRGHEEDTYSNGACISIMRSGLGDCIDNYRSTTRSDYLDELFSRRNEI